MHTNLKFIAEDRQTHEIYDVIMINFVTGQIAMNKPNQTIIKWSTVGGVKLFQNVNTTELVPVDVSGFVISNMGLQFSGCGPV
jgi:hypothetical protein